MKALWYRYKSWRHDRRWLYICSRSGPSRVPFAAVSRKAGAAASISDREVWISYNFTSGGGWRIKIIAKTDLIAQNLIQRLARRKLFSIYPDAEIDAILFWRDDHGSQPCYVGGDINNADVSPDNYVQNSNGAYINKQVVDKYDR